MTTITRAIAIILLANALAAQTVHFVGPGGFAQIQAAINAAANGDVVEIQSGAYSAFTLNKDLTLIAAPGAIVDVVTTAFFATGTTTIQPPAIAKLAGIRFRDSGSPYSLCRLQVTGGTVHFADCAFESSRFPVPPMPALRVQNASVALQRCVAIGGGAIGTGAGLGNGADALSAQHAMIAAVDCLFLGGGIHWDFTGEGGSGVRAADSVVHLANCIAIGGDNDAQFSSYVPGDGVHADTTSRVWLADCQLRGGNGHFNVGGNGLVNLAAIAVQAARSSFVGGAGTPAGVPVIGPLVTAPLLGLDGTTAAITIGAPWTIAYRAAPGTPVLALSSDALAASVLPVIAEPAWLPAASFAVATAGVTNGNGVVAFAFAVPSTPALLHASVFVQAIAGATLPLEVAPPVGGVVR